jgi:hypothetical protein
MVTGLAPQFISGTGFLGWNTTLGELALTPLCVLTKTLYCCFEITRPRIALMFSQDWRRVFCAVSFKSRGNAIGYGINCCIC